MKDRFLRIFLIGAGLVFLLFLFLLFPPVMWDAAMGISLGWIIIVAILLWFGNRYLSRWLDRNYSWLRYGKRRFFAQLFVILSYSLAVVNGAYFLFKNAFTGEPPIPEQVIVMNVYGGLLIILVSSVYFLFYFLQAWIRSQVKQEQLQKESVTAQLVALKNHLDPHFLFNNLNVLSALIDQDTERSQEFLSKFSEVYRVLLQTESRELITLEKELEFVQAYLHLIHIRFGDLLEIDMEVSPEAKRAHLPPLTLQMLIENALKHNKVSEDDPLRIEVTSDVDTLVVSNVYNPKEHAPNGHGTGLQNLERRYELLTDQKPLVSRTEDSFTVRVPLILTADADSDT